MAGQIEDYRAEIFNFLRTVTIKFEPFAYSMGEAYMSQYGIDDPNGIWNPYYINLSGEYTDSDERMTVWSIEENRSVPFDKNLVTNYPRTAALYRVNTTEYRTLEERYPGNLGLIRAIVYPIPDIQTAIDAPNLSLLAYDDSLLDVNEREDIINCLKDFLDMVRVRWWIPELDYEDMYAVTFWAILWQHLPLLLLARRFANIKTPYTHSFHFWEYLKSKGLADYRDVLTNNQSAWLYRNIDYILKNKGKTSNLTILAQNLLSEVYVSLLDKDMVQTTDENWDQNIVTTPIFISRNYVNNNVEKTETFSELNYRLVQQELEVNDSADYIADTEYKLGSHNYNQLPTKYLEFKKDPVNTANQDIMYNFFLDTLMYRFSHNDLSFNCQVTDSLLGNKLDLYVGDTILLWHWAASHFADCYSDKLPNYHRTNIPFKNIEVTKSQLPTHIHYANISYKVDQLIPVDDYLKMITWHPESYTTQSDFIVTAANQLRTILAWNRQLNTTNRIQVHLAMDVFEHAVLDPGYVTLNWGTISTFTEWRKTNELLDLVLTEYEDRDNITDYATLADACISALFPLDDATLDEFIGSLRNMEKIYASIRDLFIRLCSYNVTYLETERDTNKYLYVDDPDVATFTKLKYTISGGEDGNSGLLDILIDRYAIIFKLLQKIKLPSLSVVHEVTIDETTINTGTQEVDICYPVTLDSALQSKTLTQHNVDVYPANRVYTLKLAIDVAETHIQMKG